MSILGLYLTADRLKIKRQVIQRYTVFSEPVYSFSLQTLLDNKKINRTEYQTDTSKKISDLDFLDKDQEDKFKQSWYFTLYDIKRETPYNLYSEISLPKNAIKEIKQIANNSVEIGIDFDNNILETMDQSKVINNLIQLYCWRFLFYYEYNLRKLCFEILNRKIDKKEIKSKKQMIECIYENEKKARYNTDIISNIVNSSEDYVKDVISGRAEFGLSDEERDQILARDNHKCQNCGSGDNLEVHHIIPISQGGSKDDNNLCTLCFNCHINIAHGETTSDINYETINEFWEIVN